VTPRGGGLRDPTTSLVAAAWSPGSTSKVHRLHETALHSPAVLPRSTALRCSAASTLRHAADFMRLRRRRASERNPAVTGLAGPPPAT